MKVSLRGLGSAFLIVAMIAGALGWYDIVAGQARIYREPGKPIVNTPRVPLPFSLPPEATAPIATHNPEFVPNVVKAVNALYIKRKGQELRFACTATNIQETKDGSYFALTAKHCMADEMFIQLAANSNTPFYRATKIIEGDDADFAVVQYSPGSKQPVIPIGTEKLSSVGDAILYVGEPMDLGKLLFHGYIAQQQVADELATAHPGWRHSMGLQLPAAGGSSGSAIIDPKQEAIIAVLVGIVTPPNGGVLVTIAVPVSDIRHSIDDYNRGVRHISFDAMHENWLNHLFGLPPAR